MKKAVFLFVLLTFKIHPSWAQEPLNFSILFHGGVGESQGFLGSGNPSPEGGLWLGIGLNNRFDGLWGLDYYSMPNQPVTISQTPAQSNSFV
ncbi:MAG TPA: hypothetical protein VIJ93_11085, partial [bacterium]